MKTLNTLIAIIAVSFATSVMAQDVVQSKSGEKHQGPKAKNTKSVYKDDAASIPMLVIDENLSGPAAKNDKAGISEDATTASINSVKQPDLSSPMFKNRKNFGGSTNDIAIQDGGAVAVK